LKLELTKLLILIYNSKNSNRSSRTIYRCALPLLINARYYATYSAIAYLTAASVIDTINLILVNTSIIIQEVDTIDLQL
jgi:hypothetical protein